MTIYLHDTERDEEVKVNLTVEYALPCHDLFVVFSSTIHSGDTAFQEHRPRKVSHLIGAGFTYAKRPYTATLGFFLDGQQLVPFLVDGACADGEASGFGFGIAELAYGHYPDRQTLFHYPGAPSLLGDARPLTFREAAAKALKGDTEFDSAYAPTSPKVFTLEGLVGYGEFSEAMERALALSQES